ncbi:MAG: hypothetical protein IJX63_15600 [Lachnospiraceae bacterium]|nr:hypothetical protein [Lachnospiraceae bacterium]
MKSVLILVQKGAIALKKIGAEVIKRMAVQMGKSETEIRTEINSAIEIAYEDRNTHSKWLELFGNTRPTPEEFIVTIANYVTAGSGMYPKMIYNL